MNCADDPLTTSASYCARPAHPGNIGAAARAMKTMGLARLAPGCAADVSGSAGRVARARRPTCSERAVCATLDEALDGSAVQVACSARTREMAVPGVGARGGGARRRSRARAGGGARIRQRDLRAHRRAGGKVPVARDHTRRIRRYSSLNLAAAVQVFAYELRLRRMVRTHRASRPAPSRARGGGALLRPPRDAVSRRASSTPAQQKADARLRRLFGRSQLEKEEINILRGILKTLSIPGNAVASWSRQRTLPARGRIPVTCSRSPLKLTGLLGHRKLVPPTLSAFQRNVLFVSREEIAVVFERDPAARNAGKWSPAIPASTRC